ncbi:MAG: YicC family protein [Gammaproteobacteria bacterium]|nr:YicC family protein [Gammaproteobacteria bacterium]MCP5424652.1 YicC family protein [Gammaproteobacteria bacterium]
MIRSMTAFARNEQQSAAGLIVWELRSVNHRYLEITLRLPDPLRSLEPSLRERIEKSLSRGKIECNLRWQTATPLAQISWNRPLAERLLTIAAELEQLMGPGTGLGLADLLRWPGVVSESEPDLGPVKQDILLGLEQAIDQLVLNREREGERIVGQIAQRCATLHELVGQIRNRRPEVLARLREKWLARLAELPVEPDRNRLEQELVIIAQRLDVDEELDRLDAHLAEIHQVLQWQEPVGRRLDFLMQELNREANTLASKSADILTTHAAVELKVLIEQMREQVQNIE